MEQIGLLLICISGLCDIMCIESEKDEEIKGCPASYYCEMI